MATTLDGGTTQVHRRKDPFTMAGAQVSGAIAAVLLTFAWAGQAQAACGRFNNATVDFVLLKGDAPHAASAASSGVCVLARNWR